MSLPIATVQPVTVHLEHRGLHGALLVIATLVLGACAAGSSDATPGTSAHQLTATDLSPRGRTVTGVPVLRVVDGDTLHALVTGRDVTVRLIGVDTPETVKPDTPVECFGPQASQFAKEVLTGQRVTLEFDASQGDEDRYGRTLAYVWLELPDGQRALFNLEAVRGGFAEERQYGATPYAWKEAFASAESDARTADAGRWGACPN